MAETVGIWCRIVEAGERSVRIEDDAGRRHFLPLSQIGELPDPRHWARPVLLDVPVWLATKEGLV